MFNCYVFPRATFLRLLRPQTLRWHLIEPQHLSISFRLLGVPCLLMQNHPYWVFFLVFCDVAIVSDDLPFSKCAVGFMSLCFYSRCPERLSSLRLLREHPFLMEDSTQASSCILLKDHLTIPSFVPMVTCPPALPQHA